eukprot:GILK01015866.1.p1 GENE.GILK01015866.1~~GILK01015866.1.p1  ORF type:complete len:184 (-),score=12.60 GILK01015866.1:111-662(-)
MSASYQPFIGNNYGFWGVALPNENALVLTRRVMTVSTIMSLLVLTSFILQVGKGSSWGYMIMFAIFVPCCGYYGAKNRSSFMLNLFWIVNMLAVVSFVISLLRFLLWYMPSINPDHDVNFPVFLAAIILSGAAAFLQVLGCIWGHQLKDELVVEHTTSSAFGYATAPAYVQPKPTAAGIYAEP